MKRVLLDNLLKSKVGKNSQTNVTCSELRRFMNIMKWPYPKSQSEDFVRSHQRRGL